MSYPHEHDVVCPACGRWVPVTRGWVVGVDERHLWVECYCGAAVETRKDGAKLETG